MCVCKTKCETIKAEHVVVREEQKAADINMVTRVRMTDDNCLERFLKSQ